MLNEEIHSDINLGLGLGWRGGSRLPSTGGTKSDHRVSDSPFTDRNDFMIKFFKVVMERVVPPTFPVAQHYCYKQCFCKRYFKICNCTIQHRLDNNPKIKITTPTIQNPKFCHPIENEIKRVMVRDADCSGGEQRRDADA